TARRRNLSLGSCLEEQLFHTGDAELDVDGRAGDRSGARGLQEADRRDRPVQRVPGTNHGCVFGAREVVGAEGIFEAAGVSGRLIRPGVRRAGVEDDRRIAGGAQREVDGCDLTARGTRLDMAGEPQARVIGPWRLNRLAWSTGDAVNQRRSPARL